jgi:hypothetical protein
MPRWLPTVLERIHDLAMRGKVCFTLKALRELLTLEMGFDVDDAIDVIAGLRVSNSAGRIVSERTGEWLYIFKPRVGDTVVYLKLAIRGDCIVLSFHEDQEDELENE